MSLVYASVKGKEAEAAALMQLLEDRSLDPMIYRSSTTLVSSVVFGKDSRLINVSSLIGDFASEYLPRRAKGWNILLQLKLVEKAAAIESSEASAKMTKLGAEVTWPDLTPFCRLYREKKEEEAPQERGFFRRALGRFGWI
jgi:hypothetical protein